ncbi:hypothetical protein Tco_0620993 [Tanacetum coccineum]
MQHPHPNNNYVQQPSFNMNYMQKLMENPEDISDPITAMKMDVQIAQLGMNMGQERQMQMVRGNGGNQFRLYAGIQIGHNAGNLICVTTEGVGHYARNCTTRPRRRDVGYLQTQLLLAQKDESGIQLQADEFDLMAADDDCEEIEEM